MPKTTSVPVRQDARPEARSEARPAVPSRLGGLRDEIDRLFDAFEPRQWLEHPFAALSGIAGTLSPAMDLTENGSSYALRMEVPGIDPGRIEVKLSNGTLFVSGEKTEEKMEEGEDYHVSERRWGSFRRSIRLPGDVDQEKIEASCANGVLTVRLPKSAAAIAAEKTIDVKAA